MLKNSHINTMGEGVRDLYSRTDMEATILLNCQFADYKSKAQIAQMRSQLE